LEKVRKSGKSVTAMSILKLFEHNQKIHSGEIWFDGEKISSLTQNELRKIRGNDISVIFQEPMTSLNPVLTVTRQISEVLMLHQDMTKDQAHARTIELLGLVGISNPEKDCESILIPAFRWYESTCYDCDGISLSSKTPNR
jgi:peptide/nickel transport system ATP-binding protein